MDRYWPTFSRKLAGPLPPGGTTAAVRGAKRDCPRGRSYQRSGRSPRPRARGRSRACSGVCQPAAALRQSWRAGPARCLAAARLAGRAARLERRTVRRGVDASRQRAGAVAVCPKDSGHLATPTGHGATAMRSRTRRRHSGGACAGRRQRRKPGVRRLVARYRNRARDRGFRQPSRHCPVAGPRAPGPMRRVATTGAPSALAACASPARAKSARRLELHAHHRCSDRYAARCVDGDGLARRARSGPTSGSAGVAGLLRCRADSDRPLDCIGCWLCPVDRRCDWPAMGGRGADARRHPVVAPPLAAALARLLGPVRGHVAGDRPRVWESGVAQPVYQSAGRSHGRSVATVRAGVHAAVAAVCAAVAGGRRPCGAVAATASGRVASALAAGLARATFDRPGAFVRGVGRPRVVLARPPARGSADGSRDGAGASEHRLAPRTGSRTAPDGAPDLAGRRTRRRGAA